MSRCPTTEPLPTTTLTTPSGDPRLETQLAQPERRERRQLGGLEDDRVPARERRPELPARDVRAGSSRARSDRRRRAARGTSTRRRLRRESSRRRACRSRRRRSGRPARPSRSRPAPRDRLADVLGLDARRAPRRSPRRASPAAGAAAPGRRGNRAPRRKRRLRPRDRGIRFLDAGLLELRDRQLRGRVQDGERHARPRLCRMRQIP